MTKIGKLRLAGAMLLLLALPGCNRTTYTYRCVDGFASKAYSDAEALAGCGTHGGSLSKTPEVSRPASRSGSSYRPSRLFRSRSSARRSRRR